MEKVSSLFAKSKFNFTDANIVLSFCTLTEFELVIEFNGDECVDSTSPPVARTKSKTMRLPGSAYHGDASIFKEKLIESLKSCKPS